MDKAHRIKDAEHAGEGGQIRQGHVDDRSAMGLKGFRKEHLLGQESIEQRHAGHRSGGDHRQRRGDRHEAR